MSSANFPKQVTLGYAGEHDARAIAFDCSEEFEKWPDAEARVMYVRPTERKDDLVYPGATSVDGNIVYWTPDAFAMELEGSDGYCQIFFYSPEDEPVQEDPQEGEGTEEEEEEEGEEENLIPEYLGKSALVRTTVLPALWAQQSDPILESAEYASLFRRMENAAKTIERMTVVAEDGDQASVSVTTVNGRLNMAFTLPRGEALTYDDLTPEQKEELRGERGFMGETGEQGPKGDKGDKGDTGTVLIGDMDPEQQAELLGLIAWIDATDVDTAFSALGLNVAESE